MSKESKCICPTRARYECFAIRYHAVQQHDGTDECCECLCHDEYEDDLEDQREQSEWNDIAESEGRTRESWPAPTDAAI